MQISAPLVDCSNIQTKLSYQQLQTILTFIAIEYCYCQQTQHHHIDRHHKGTTKSEDYSVARLALPLDPSWTHQGQPQMRWFASGQTWT
jgi:hypothetical protein